jgi:hypothetical protein
MLQNCSKYEHWPRFLLRGTWSWADWRPTEIGDERFKFCCGEPGAGQIEGRQKYERRRLRRTGSKLWRWKVDETSSVLCLIPSVVVGSAETSCPIMRKVLKFITTDHWTFIYLFLEIKGRVYAEEFTLLCGKIESKEISLRFFNSPSLCLH